MPSFRELVPVAGQQGRPMMPFGRMENRISIDRDRNGDRPGIFPWKGVPWKSFVGIARHGQARTGKDRAAGKEARADGDIAVVAVHGEFRFNTRCRPSS